MRTPHRAPDLVSRPATPCPTAIPPRQGGRRPRRQRRLCISRSPISVARLPTAWPPPTAVPSVVAGEVDISNPSDLLHGRSDELIGVVVVCLLKENVSFRDDTLAKVRPLRRGSRPGRSPDDGDLRGRRIQIPIAVCLTPCFPRVFLAPLRVQPTDGAIVSLAAAAVAKYR